MKNYDAQKTQISWGMEWPDFVDLTGGSVATYQVTGLSGLTVDRYNGQMCWVQYRGGSVDGKIFHIVSNTATAITFEENVATAGLANTDTISITTRGQMPTDITEVFADVLETDLPEPNVTIKEEFAHGSADHPQRKGTIRAAINYESTLSVNVVNCKLFMLNMGKCTDVASAYGAGSTTTTRAAGIGEEIIAVTAATNFLVGDYIEVGDNSGGSLDEGSEIREITAINTLNLTLSDPLRRYHPSGCAIKECDLSGANYITHTLGINPDLWGFALEAVFKGFDPNVTTNDMVLHYLGLIGKGMSLKSSEDSLKLDLAVNGLDALIDEQTRATLDTTDWLEDPYHYDESLVTINSVDFGQVETLDWGSERSCNSKHYHNQDTGIKPYEHALGKPKHSLKIGIMHHNKTFWNYVNDGTEFDVSLKFTRSATDYFTFLYEDCVLVGDPVRMPEEGEIIVDGDYNPRKLTITAVDTIEYY